MKTTIRFIQINNNKFGTNRSIKWLWQYLVWLDFKTIQTQMLPNYDNLFMFSIFSLLIINQHASSIDHYCFIVPIIIFFLWWTLLQLLCFSSNHSYKIMYPLHLVRRSKASIGSRTYYIFRYIAKKVLVANVRLWKSRSF